jgi:hypothetical protein
VSDCISIGCVIRRRNGAPLGGAFGGMQRRKLGMVVVARTDPHTARQDAIPAA